MTKTIKDFHDDDVWRDEDGIIWVRQSEALEAVKLVASLSRETGTEDSPADWEDPKPWISPDRISQRDSREWAFWHYAPRTREQYEREVTK